MAIAAFLRRHVKAARRRGAAWVGLVDVLRRLTSAAGRSELATAWLHPGDAHQLTGHSDPGRYADLFARVAALTPDAEAVLSFGCATGEEVAALRKLFPEARIVGAEINRRSRRLAARRLAGDPRSTIVAPGGITGDFDVVFALAVLQREPHRIEEAGIADLSTIYPFDKFDRAVGDLVDRLRRGGLLCVDFAHYRVEDSAAFARLDPVGGAPPVRGQRFAPDGRLRDDLSGSSLFRKRVSDGRGAPRGGAR